MGETHEIPHHNLADFEPRLIYATIGQAVGVIPLPNTLHFAAGRLPPAMAEKGKLDHIEESLMVIKGGGDHVFC